MTDEHQTEIIEQPVDQKNKKSRAIFWGNLGMICSGLAAAVLMIVIGVAIYGLLATSDTLATHVAELSDNVLQSKDTVLQTQKSVTDIRESTQQMTDELKTQSQAILELQKNQRSNKDDLLVAEAQYLVKVANDSLVFENNISLAIKLLQSADQDIAKLNDPKLLAVRQAIAADLLALQSAHQVDVSGLYACLIALNDQVDKLPVLNKFSNDQAQTATEPANEKLSWWRRGLQATGQALMRIVIVRKGQMNVPPFLTPDQQSLLYQNLHSEIEKAEWGLLHQNTEIYHSSLQQALTWIKQYALQDSPITQQISTSLTQLMQIDVQPTRASAADSLRALQGYLAENNHL
ncbi:MAG: uroporphyrinogen-III C-methyltransferase [Gammaproteobacteria bacterium]